jgi:3'-phosphoadenosine 5'-phosphosulfate sulfotransferase (PAPS reductase)/FAD synthetase
LSNPYLITGPALISFSGGRTSAFMLRQILDAHGGALPDDVVVAFANTGKEREETLRFVHECGSRWGVKVHWLERADEGGFVEVGYNSASRDGEPFAALIAKRKFTPNAVTRFCTSELKVRVMRDFCLSLGWGNWSNVVGLRYDEGLRVLKMIARNEAGKERWTSLMPISKAKHVKRDVMAFWAAQDFDLGLKDYEGNCDLCFLKSRGKLEQIIRENPGIADWWSRMETASKGRFVTEYSYAKLADHVARSPVMPGILDDEEYDAECGLTCEPLPEAAE